MTTPEPPSVIDARHAVGSFNKRLGVYLGGVGVTMLGLLGAGMADAPQAAMMTIVGLYTAWTIGGMIWMRPHKIKDARHVVQEWESRALREEFARFDSAVAPESDPRLEAARSMATRIRALDASPASTDEMVTRLEARLARLVTDQSAAAAAVTALTAAGAGSTGTGRLADAAKHLEEEIARILSGMSELYAALLEAEPGGHDEALGEVMGWLAAEAEIARAAQQGPQIAEPAAEGANEGLADIMRARRGRTPQ